MDQSGTLPPFFNFDTRTVPAGHGGAEGRLQDDGAYLASLAPSLREEGNVKAEETQIAFKAGAYLASLAPSLREEGNVEAE